MEDIHEAETVRTLLMDLQDVRRVKMRRALGTVREISAVKYNNVTLMELNTIRPFVAETLSTFHRLHMAAFEAREEQ